MSSTPTATSTVAVKERAVGARLLRGRSRGSPIPYRTVRDARSFTDEVKRVLDLRGMRTSDSPAGLLDAWQAFVRQCAAGYGWDLSEYDNDIAPRRRIEALLVAPELRGYSELDEFSSRVRHIDDEFRALLKPGVRRGKPGASWWEDGILRRAGPEYRRDVFSLYKLTVEEQP